MPNKMERFTQRARRVLGLAQEEAEYFRQALITPEHVLLGLLREEGGVGGRVLRDLNLDYEQLKNAINAKTPLIPETKPRQIDLAPETKKLLEYSVDEARRMGHQHIGTEHLLLGLTRLQSSYALQLLRDHKVSPEKIRQITQDILQTESKGSTSEAPLSPPSWRPVAKARQFSFSGVANRVRHYNLQRELDRTPLSNEALDRLTGAIDEARQMGMQQVEVEHLLLSLLQSNRDIWDKLGYNPIEIDTLRGILRQSIESRQKP